MLGRRNLKTVSCFVALLCVGLGSAAAQPIATPAGSELGGTSGNDASSDASELPTLDELKTAGAQHSRYAKQQFPTPRDQVPKQKLDSFRTDIAPLVHRECAHCHGPDLKEGNIRIDTLDPDLVRGEDVDWWLEVFAVLSNGEMPPPGEGELSDDERNRIVEWLSSEIQIASTIRRAEQKHSSFRRLTRYETNYALQDLLGLRFNFAKDLPPEASSEEGFKNSSEVLHMSAQQFATYRELARNALHRATVRGDQPDLLYWGVTMEAASAREWAGQEAELDKIKKAHQDDPDQQKRELERTLASFRVRHARAHYKNLATGQTAIATWGYPEAKYAWKPAETRPAVPPTSEFVAVIPPRQKLIVELGDRIPEEGTLRVRVRASRASADDDRLPSLQLDFGWQASNDSHASVRISDQDLLIDALPDEPRFYQWDIALSEIYPRNLVRNVSQLGDLPSPSEYVRFVNSSVSSGDILIDYVEIMAPVYDQWPPASHTRIFVDSENRAREAVYAKEIISGFLPRAWRRPVTEAEIEQKLALFADLRPECDDFQDAMIEVLATVLASPKFLYVGPSASGGLPEKLGPYELATRLSLFLWCSIPDDQLRELAGEGRLSDSAVLANQVDRLLADDRSRRFSEHFVRQWLGLQLLDYLEVDETDYPQFDPALKEAMQEEPIALFRDVLRGNHSVMDFLHADYTMANERLAEHYGLKDVRGNHFRRVSLEPQDRRGGLLTQAGLLAMNSDGKDSHPLKRGIWLLEKVLDDPPPPPPPAVPQIDVADPEIAKLTLKQRLENHRNQAACKSCHMKIDPWGIAFENFDAIGNWRTHINGEPVDATSVLFNQQELNGIEGLKRFLLANRQDQFARAIVHKMMTYAIGRPLRFSDRAEVDRITAELRGQGDGLATLVNLIVQSDLFREK